MNTEDKRLFTYFHCYLPQTWDAQIKAGLIGHHAGIRFSQSIDIKDELKFNNLAAVNGVLYNIVKENHFPFYIDRLQGGCYMEQYPYDMNLVQKYREILSDNFYGFQMHEWMSNYLSDLGKLINNGCTEWTEESITRTIQQAFPFPHIFLESMNAKEMADAGRPKTYDEFLDITTNLFYSRQKYTHGDLIPCDSAFLSYPVEIRAGVKRIMAEIGAQTYDTRIQVAFARGMAKNSGIKFGTYYEPWGGTPFSACSYQKDGENEWNIHSGTDFPFETNGANGGSSRSMQLRMHLYSYFAGASFMAEEWGMCNTFYDWHDFELSPYGLIKKRFLDFVDRYPDIGEPVTPIAVVLPKSMKVLENVRCDTLSYLTFPAEDSLGEVVRKARRGIRELFCSSGPMRGSETTSLLNCTISDALDIVTEDVLDMNKYSYLVDLTSNAEFAQLNSEKICKIDEVPKILDSILPCSVTGNAMKQFTKNSDNKYYVLLTNNSGVIRTVEHGDEFLSDATETISLKVMNNRIIERIEGSSLSIDEHGIYHTDIPAGGYFFGVIYCN